MLSLILDPAPKISYHSVPSHDRRNHLQISNIQPIIPSINSRFKRQQRLQQCPSNTARRPTATLLTHTFARQPAPSFFASTVLDATMNPIPTSITAPAKAWAP